MGSRISGHRAPVIWLLLPWIAGLSLGKGATFPIPLVAFFSAAAIAAGISVLGARFASLWLGGVVASGVLGGAAWYEAVRARLPEWDSLPAREARLWVCVDRVFSPSADARKVSGLGRVSSAEGHLRGLVGQSLYFSGRLVRSQARPIRSAELELVGQLQVLAKSPPADTFDGYLAGTGVNFILARARVVAERTPPHAYWRWCESTRAAMSDALDFGLAAHPELVGVLRAMMLGQQYELSEEQGDWFTQSGTMHLFSISGLHIGVISLALMGLLAILRMPPAGRFLALVVLLWLYVDITGRVPSAVRAFLMIAVLKAGSVLRAPSNPVSALVVSAMLVLVVDPMQLFGASFQMSYGIVAALLVLGLPLAEAWERRWPLYADLPPALWQWNHRAVAWAWRATLGTVAVGLATTPVSVISGVLYFGLVTPGALVANLATIPAASLALLGGFASLVATLLGEPAVSLLFNHAAALVLLAIDRGTEAFVTLPGVYLTAHFSSAWIGFVALAGLLALLLFGYHFGWSRRVGGFWPPFAFTALTMIFLVTFG